MPVTKQMVDYTEINRKQYWYRRKTLLIQIENSIDTDESFCLYEEEIVLIQIENSIDTLRKWYRYIAKIVSIQMENNID